MGSVDVTEERPRHVLPTVTGIAARLTLAVLKKQNVAVAPLLRRAGLSEHDFDGRQQRISAAPQGKFPSMTVSFYFLLASYFRCKIHS
jgi:hypothetical protein